MAAAEGIPLRVWRCASLSKQGWVFLGLVSRAGFHFSCCWCESDTIRDPNPGKQPPVRQRAGPRRLDHGESAIGHARRAWKNRATATSLLLVVLARGGSDLIPFRDPAHTEGVVILFVCGGGRWSPVPWFPTATFLVGDGRADVGGGGAVDLLGLARQFNQPPVPVLLRAGCETSSASAF